MNIYTLHVSLNRVTRSTITGRLFQWNINKYQHNCIHIENLLSVDDQIKLWHHVKVLSVGYTQKHKKNDRCNFYKLFGNNGIHINQQHLLQQFYDIIHNSCFIASNVSQFIPLTFEPQYLTFYIIKVNYHIMSTKSQDGYC